MEEKVVERGQIHLIILLVGVTSVSVAFAFAGFLVLQQREISIIRNEVIEMCAFFTSYVQSYKCISTLYFQVDSLKYEITSLKFDHVSDLYSLCFHLEERITQSKLVKQILLQN